MAAFVYSVLGILGYKVMLGNKKYLQNITN